MSGDPRGEVEAELGTGLEVSEEFSCSHLLAPDLSGHRRTEIK